MTHLNQSDASFAAEIFPQLVLAIPFVFVLVLYGIAAMASGRKHTQWPVYRTVCWVLGVLLAILSVAGPLADRAHSDFSAHMISHLFLGMLAPLLMALGYPVTLMLRSLSVPLARRVSKVLRSRISQILTNPIFASFLNIGGLWLVYTTDLYSLMHESILLHLIVHFHVFLAGYLFTVSIVYFDPIPHRIPFISRAIVLVAALAGHGILSKYIYANPPAGVPAAQAELGSMIMYYGGDAVDILLIFLFCLQWYRSGVNWKWQELKHRNHA
ncbi:MULTISPECIES: cytochrome c oxidase assembly protein [Cytobacillus]|uniref:cytochrome c oxidase assembly protein n=1 Tax=Cytobacillus TaxID=2675230 RepID=UPI00203FED65|nr:cytochrome c oxidase assembly protein [Cytobacillus firmus]MCM3706813.1 cytochrome c oxidase assembly protein [Cytobacillus firmus]